MPLSKKRNRERMKRIRATCVQPKVMKLGSGIDGWGLVLPDDAVQPKQPIPNCPDGRYRE